MINKPDYLNNVFNKSFLEKFMTIVSVPYAEINLTGYINMESMQFPTGMTPDSITNMGQMLEALGWGAIKGLIKKFSGSSIEKEHSIRESVKGYGVPNDISFSVSIDILLGKDGNPSTVKDLMTQLNKLTLANVDNAGLYETYLYDNSMMKQLFTDYTIFDGQLIHLSIGNWFEASGLLCTSVNPSLSTITDDNGKPLFVKVDFTFESYRKLTAEELASFFKA